MPADVRGAHGHLVRNSSPTRGCRLPASLWMAACGEWPPVNLSAGASLTCQQGVRARAPFMVSGENEAVPSCLCMALSSITELSLSHCIWGLQKYTRLEMTWSCQYSFDKTIIARVVLGFFSNSYLRRISQGQDVFFVQNWEDWY